MGDNSEWGWGWGGGLKSTAVSREWGLQSTLTSFMVVLFCSQRHSITLILLQGEEGRGWGEGKGGGRRRGRSTCTRAGQVGPSGPESSSRPRPLWASPAPAAVSPPPRGRCCAWGPYPRARRPRCPALAPRSLVPASRPASAKSNNSPCVRAPAPSSAEAAGAARRGWEGGSGQPAPRPLARPRAAPRGPQRFNGRVSSCGGAEEGGEKVGAERYLTFGAGVGRRGSLGQKRGCV